MLLYNLPSWKMLNGFEGMKHQTDPGGSDMGYR